MQIKIAMIFFLIPVRMTVFEKSEELPVLVRMEGECFMTFPGETGTNTYSPKIGH